MAFNFKWGMVGMDGPDGPRISRNVSNDSMGDMLTEMNKPWGERMFQSRLEFESAAELSVRYDIPLIDMISSTYPSWVTAESLQKDDTAEHQAALNKLIIEVRAKLDTGIGQKILQEAWSSVTRHFFEGEPIFAAALLLRAGAKISPGDLKHLRKLAEKIEPPSVKNMNVGLCGPGRAQFMAALDSYKHGIPRNFCEPSCFCCGKTEVDTGRPPFSCKSCKDKGLEGWYCDRACQKKDWQQHKKTCGKPTGVTKAF